LSHLPGAGDVEEFQFQAHVTVIFANGAGIPCYARNDKMTIEGSWPYLLENQTEVPYE